MPSVSQNPSGSTHHRLTHRTSREGRVRLRRLGSLLLTGLLLAQAVPVLGAGVTVVANVGTWAGDGPGTTATVLDGTGGLAQFDYSLNRGGDFDAKSWSFQTTATSSGTVPMTWRLTGFHAWYQVTLGLEAYVKPQGGAPAYTSVLGAGPANCCTEPSGGFDYAGTTSLTVQAGDEFGFRITGDNYDANNVLQGSLRVGLNVVSNGGFEDPAIQHTATFDTYGSQSSQLTGWDVTTGSIDHIGEYWHAAEGDQSVDLDGSAAGTITQTVPTVPNQAYRVAFQYSANGDRPAAQAKPKMIVKADGTSLGTFDHGFAAANPNINWAAGEASFVATGTSTVLSFVSDDDAASPWGIALDAITVVPDLSIVPAPPGFSFDAPGAGATDADPLELTPGTSHEVTIPVVLTHGATSVDVGVAGVAPAASGVSATAIATATETATVTVSAAANAPAGNSVVTVAGNVGSVSDTVPIYVTVLPPAPDFSFGTPSAGSDSGQPLSVAQGTSAQSLVGVSLLNGAASVATSVEVNPAGGGVTATTGATATTSAAVVISAGPDTEPGTYQVTLSGAVGDLSHDAIIHVSVPAPAAVGIPQLTNAYHAAGAATTLVAGRITATANTTYTIGFASAASCPSGIFPVGSTDFGAISVTTDSNGNAFFNSTTPPGAVTGHPETGESFIAAHVTGPHGRNSGFSPCVVNSPDNDTWPRALLLSGNGGPAPAGTWIDQPGAARWFKVHVVPGGSVTLDLSNVPADYDVYLFRDIQQTYDALTTEQDLVKMSAEFAGSGFSGSGFSGSGFSGSGFSGSGFSGSGFSGSGFSGSGFSPDSYSGSGFSGSGFSGSGFSGSGFSGSGFSGSGFSGSGFSGSGFSGSGFSADSFSAAQVYSLIAWSNNLGLATEHAASNTWTSTGDFYIRVNGKNGVASLDQPFTLEVALDGNLCSGVNPSNLNPIAVDSGLGSLSTLILTDTSRFGGAATSTMVSKLGEVGHVVDLAADGRVQALQAQADENAGCVYAKNLVASAAKDVVDAYRSAYPSVRYIVLAGGDDVVPFFRYPDTSSIGPEVNYFPPVESSSTSEASLRSNYTLGQDAYGSTMSISHGPVDFPIPGLPVGRLVESPSEITGMAQAYLDQHTVIPGTSLVTGYDFIADAAASIKGSLDAGTGQAGQALVDPYGASPATGWNATALKSALLGSRNDITFLGGHFSANSALAADFTTVMTTDDFAASPTNFANTIIFSIGCHSGYNLVDAHGIPNVTRTLDWPQVFSQRQVTSILGTGYQYGDTDFIEYSERIYSEFSKQLLYGSGPVGIGNALVAAKLAYLKETPAVGDLHEKALLESALYGLPMLGIDMPSGRTPAPSDSSAIPLTPFGTEPGITTGLRYHDIDQSTPSVEKTKTLNVQGGGTLTARYLTAPGGGVLTTPGAPVLPLYSTSARASDAGYVLRGVGFLGGAYSDASVTPLTGAPGTELQSAHTSFSSPTFYPTEMWSANYFDALGGGGGVTLFTTPAQHRADVPGGDVVTLRTYGNLNLRLFYSNTTASGSKSAPPAIYGVRSDLETGANPPTRITAHVVGDPKADVQQVWVTYTEPGSGLWGSFELVRDGTDPTLWARSMALAAGTQFIVQAVNGFGVVSRNDNSAAYYQAGVAATTPAPGSIELSGATDGAYGSTASVTATLKSGGTPVAAGRLVTLTLGSVTRSGHTNGNGKVTVSMPLSAGAGTYPLTATFLGDAETAPASAAESFTIIAATSSTTITCPASVGYSGSAQSPCTAVAEGAGGLYQPLAVAYSDNLNPGTATATATFYGDAAHVGSDATTTFAITKLGQTITFSSPAPVPAPTKLTTDPDFTVVATASSSLPVALSASGSCTITGQTVHITGIGTCTIKANQAGTQIYSAAPEEVLNISVTWPFDGFLWPVANPPTINIARAGGWVPLRFSLGGDRGLGIIQGGAPTVSEIACPVGPPAATVDQTGAFQAKLIYVKLTGRYLYAWKVPQAYKNRCYQLQLKLVDGSTHLANFKFR